MNHIGQMFSWCRLRSKLKSIEQNLSTKESVAQSASVSQNAGFTTNHDHREDQFINQKFLERFWANTWGMLPEFSPPCWIGASRHFGILELVVKCFTQYLRPGGLTGVSHRCPKGIGCIWYFMPIVSILKSVLPKEVCTDGSQDDESSKSQRVWAQAASLSCLAQKFRNATSQQLWCLLQVLGSEFLRSSDPSDSPLS